MRNSSTSVDVYQRSRRRSQRVYLPTMSYLHAAYQRRRSCTSTHAHAPSLRINKLNHFMGRRTVNRVIGSASRLSTDINQSVSRFIASIMTHINRNITRIRSTKLESIPRDHRNLPERWFARCALVYATADEAVTYMFCRCFFLFFFSSAKNMRQPFSGTAERIFMKLLYQMIAGNM